MTANQVSVAWDPVETNVDGEPITGTISYKIYYRTALSEVEAFVATTTDTRYTFTFTVEGRYYMGVRAVRNVDVVEIGSSIISWSDNPAVCQDGKIFGAQYFKLPSPVGGLRTP